MTKEQFFRYLKEKGIYKSWLNNLDKEIKIYNYFLVIERFGNIKKFIDYFIEYNQPEEIIMNSFSWDKTNEGSHFWSNIYNEIKTINDGEKNIEECYVGAHAKEKAQ